MPNTNNKKRGATVDLILGDKELKKVPQGIDLYTCLEILYLNNNPITKLTGLAMNFRIRFLDMSSCKLTTLVGSDLPKLKNLETLILRGNAIGDIKRQTEVFQCLPSLARLEVANNPMACEEDADLYLIALLPKLSILDCHSITGPVRQKANEKCKMNNWIAKDVKEEDPMRDKLVDPVGLRNTAKPKKIVFQKRCSYRRKPISRSELSESIRVCQQTELKERGR